MFDLTTSIFAIAAIFIAIPLMIFLAISKRLNNRHKERMAMIEKGINPDFPSSTTAQDTMNAAYQDGTQANDPAIQYTTEEYQKPRKTTPSLENRTIKTMYILVGLSIGLILSSITESIIFEFTMLKTEGTGFAIILICISISMYMYHHRRNSIFTHSKKNQDTTYNE